MSDTRQAEPITVVVVDDHAMVREAITLALGRAPDIDVVAEAECFTSGLHAITDRQPDLALIDYSLPGGDGVELAVAVQKDSPHTRNVILTASEDAEAPGRAVAAGLSGLIRKSQDLSALAQSLRRARSGDAVFETQMLSEAMAWLQEGRVGAAHGLSDRELDVLSRLAEGRATLEIADSLHLSHHTVRNHVRNILMKLNARSQLEAVVIAASFGLVEVGRDQVGG